MLFLTIYTKTGQAQLPKGDHHILADLGSNPSIDNYFFSSISEGNREKNWIRRKIQDYHREKGNNKRRRTGPNFGRSAHARWTKIPCVVRFSRLLDPNLWSERKQIKKAAQFAGQMRRPCLPATVPAGASARLAVPPGTMLRVGFRMLDEIVGAYILRTKLTCKQAGRQLNWSTVAHARWASIT